jgi:hypothetical protein
VYSTRIALVEAIISHIIIGLEQGRILLSGTLEFPELKSPELSIKKSRVKH